MLALGLSSKREITRTRIRVRTAMAAQTREEGRYLGGLLLVWVPAVRMRRPHPNKPHAAGGAGPCSPSLRMSMDGDGQRGYARA